MTPNDLLSVAGYLTRANQRRPSQAMLRRASSAVYYAVFHALARCCADRFVGGQAVHRASTSWVRVYRALEHGLVKQACTDGTAMRMFLQDIREFGTTIVTLQANRHDADDNPQIRLLKSDVTTDIGLAADAIEKLGRCGAADQRAFCAHVLFKQRR